MPMARGVLTLSAFILYSETSRINFKNEIILASFLISVLSILVLNFLLISLTFGALSWFGHTSKYQRHHAATMPPLCRLYAATMLPPSRHWGATSGATSYATSDWAATSIIIIHYDDSFLKSRSMMTKALKLKFWLKTPWGRWHVPKYRIIKV